MFPNDPLGLRIELKTGTAWTDITGDVYTRDPITHTRGLRNAGTSADPASVPLTINNKGGKYSPRNPESPYYGLIGRNTPVRLTVPGAPVHLAADGTPDAQLSTPYTADLTTDTLDVRVDMEPQSWDATTSQQHIVSMWDDSDPALRGWEIYLYAGYLYLVWTAVDGAVWNYGAIPPAAMPRRAVLRVTADVTVDGLTHVRMFWAPSMDGPWTRFGRDAAFSFPTPFRPTVVPLVVSRRGLTGAVYRAQVRSSEDAILADLDLTAAQPGATSLTDETGRTWTASTATAVTDRWPRFVGEVSSWPQRWTPGEHDVWTSVEAAGVLRRYGQGVKALDSPLRRRIPSGSPVAYWPMEDGREATQAYSPIPRVQPLILAGASMAADDTLAGSLPVPVFSGIASFGQQVPRGADGAWMVSYVYRMDAPPPGKFRALDVQTTGVARRLTLDVASDRYWFTGYGAQGQQLFQLYYTIRNGDFFQTWNRLEITARLRGAQTEYHHGWIPVENAVGTGNEAYITGAPGHVTSVAMSGNVGDTGGGGISLGHLAVLPSADTSLYDRADSAYAGESVRTRMTRLALEEGVPLSFERGFGTPQMGGQTADTLLTLLQSGAETDGGRLTEDPARIGLRYRERATLYTQEPALVLDYQAPGLAPPLEPVDDDQDVRNDITVQRAGGSSARAVLDAGPLSVQDPPAGIGRYDESVTLSLYRDDQPADHAAWRLHLGAWDGARYPAVKVLLHKAPHLIPAVLRLHEGDLLRLVNLPGWISREPVDLIVEGWTETLLPRRWEITLVCSPGGPWMTAVADHPVYGKAGTDGSELASALTTTATTVRVRTTDGPTWTTDPAETPVDIAIGGETMRVTAIGEPVSGVQTCTVARSLNGVVKSHAASSSVALAHPAIASL